jgi:hypothetical protein
MQTSYSELAPTGRHGLLTEGFYDRYIDTVIPQTIVKVGRFLVADTTVGKVRNAAMLPAATGEVTGPRAMGFTFEDFTREGNVDYPAFRPIGVVRRGRLWLTSETAQTRWTNPFIRFTANGGNDVGGIRNDADTARAVQNTKVLVLTDCAAGELCLVEINL